MPKLLNVGSRDVTVTGPEEYVKDLLSWSEPLDGRKRPYASSVGYCPRQNFLFSKPQKQLNHFSAPNAIYMGIGNGVEEFLYRRFEENDKALASNIYLPDLRPEWNEIDIGGKIDIVGLDHNDEIAIWEVKTCGKLPVEPKLSHLRQVQVYSIFGGFNRANLIYFSRDVIEWPNTELQVRNFVIDTSYEALFPVTKQVFYTFEALALGILPNQAGGFRKSSECKYCPFKDECHSFHFEMVYETLDEDGHNELWAIAEKKANSFWDFREEANGRIMKSVGNQISDKMFELIEGKSGF